METTTPTGRIGDPAKPTFSAIPAVSVVTRTATGLTRRSASGTVSANANGRITAAGCASSPLSSVAPGTYRTVRTSASAASRAHAGGRPPLMGQRYLVQEGG